MNKDFKFRSTYTDIAGNPDKTVYIAVFHMAEYKYVVLNAVGMLGDGVEFSVSEVNEKLNNKEWIVEGA